LRGHVNVNVDIAKPADGQSAFLELAPVPADAGSNVSADNRISSCRTRDSEGETDPAAPLTANLGSPRLPKNARIGIGSLQKRLRARNTPER
jgi:hypothetical protein